MKENREREREREKNTLLQLKSENVVEC
jgi:hypothetical protein